MFAKLKLLAATVLLALSLPSIAYAQCTGVVANNQGCINLSGGQALIVPGTVVGTSGHVIPVLDVANVWSANQAMNAAGANWTITSVTAGNSAFFQATGAAVTGTARFGQESNLSGGALVGGSAATDAVFVNTASAGRLVFGTNNTAIAFMYPSGCFFIGTSPGDCGANALQVPTLNSQNMFGGSSPSVPITIKATTNLSPSGDSISVVASTINLSAIAGIGSTVNCGTANSTGCTFTLAGGSSGSTAVIASSAASGTLTLPAATDQLVGRATADTLTNKTLTSPTITGGTINNATVGATTPNTGKFTSVTDTGLAAQGTVCNSAAGLLSTTTGVCAGVSLARNQTLPSNQTGTASTSAFVMDGLSSGTTRFTPTSTGNILFIISGDAANSTINDGCQIRIQYGTGGNGPANGAATTGTVAGITTGLQTLSTPANANVPFTAVGYATGLSLAAYWYDLGFAAATGGTCTLTSITMTAMEM